eukprot:1731593-Amphidinium_carterae.1
MACVIGGWSGAGKSAGGVCAMSVAPFDSPNCSHLAMQTQTIAKSIQLSLGLLFEFLLTKKFSIAFSFLYPPPLQYMKR